MRHPSTAAGILIEMHADAVLGSLTALMDAEPEVAVGFLMAAVYCQALRTGNNPRDIADALWKALPDSTTWPGFRAALVATLEQ